MQKTLTLLLFLSIAQFTLHAQDMKTDEIKHTKGKSLWMVAAENLNFRDAPNLNSKVIGQFENNELLELLELLETSDFEWYKIRRKDKSEGYVHSKYIIPVNSAYGNYQDCSKLGNLNWYGIFQNGANISLNKVNPKLQSIDDYSMILMEDNNLKFFISTQEFIQEGEIQAYLNSNDEFIRIGTNRQLYSDKGFNYSIVFAGEYLYEGYLTRTKERIYLQRKTVTSTTTWELSQFLDGYGEYGYQLHFVGDINGDDIPEIIISEATTQYATFYYIMSNSQGKLELQSKTYSDSKC